MSDHERAQISASTVVAHLSARGLSMGSHPTVTALEGGVSGTVLLVEGGGRRVVVKQALDRLLVDQDWRASPERALTEAAAMRELQATARDRLPEVLDVSPADCTFVMTAAPTDWEPWKHRLLTGPIDPLREGRVAHELGAVLARWHRGTAGDTRIADLFADYAALEQLRIGPFHRAVAHHFPALGPAVEQCMTDLLHDRQCLVHGDFSPKNILVDPRDDTALWVLDFEVAHYGAAVFDLAFMHTHLLLKAIHRPDQAHALRDVATAFDQGYRSTTTGGPDPLVICRLGWHTACLLLARVHGTSPAAYLSDSQREHVSAAAVEALKVQDVTVEVLWARACGNRP